MEDDDVFQPVSVDSWEISPDYIIMDCMLGEGQFGEVYKGMIKGIVNNPYFKGSEASFVAVKILRGLYTKYIHVYSVGPHLSTHPFWMKFWIK